MSPRSYFLDSYSADGTLLGQIHATEEQQSIIHAAISTRDNLLISALAGAAKTTTLEFICKYLPVAPALSLAFNKRIAETLSKRLPGHVQCRTMNSLGHRVWSAATGRRLTLAFRKSYDILKTQVEDLSRSDRQDSYDSLAETLRAITWAKRLGYIPLRSPAPGKPLVSHDDFYASLEEEPTSLQVSLIEATLCRSITQAYDGTIDFDDQIYMPTLFGGSFPRFPLVLVDEAQDLSEINHAMLRRLVTNRIIAVGDPYQSIYGFRGAKSNGMASLSSTYSCVSLPLSTSFRCPKEIVLAAHFRAPTMKWHSLGGHVEHLDTLSCHDIPDGSAIICRNNAPLFRLALVLLGAGRGVHLVGTDLGPQLIKVLEKLGPETLTQEETYAAIDAWEREKLAKARNPASTTDKAECLRVFNSFGTTLGGAIAYARHIFAATGPIQLLSGHKAKGLEFDIVYHLDPWRIPSKYAFSPAELEQEQNLRYVITTRAKKALYMISSDKITTEPSA
jgi:DNA helicase-2/ATP-dependent DNA helicase PcrA